MTMTPSSDPPLSLRPQPVDDKKPKNLAEFIARVNARPDGFRALSEKKLRDEIGKRHDEQTRNVNGDVAAGKDVEMVDAGDDDHDQTDQDDEEGTAAQDPNEARMEVLKNIDIAGNTALLTLDFLSLLLSKQNPTQASATLSQGLRDLVGIGTMGADRLDESNITDAKVRDQEEIAIGWTLMETNKACEAADAAREFLDREMTAEGRFWEEVMAVQKSGWSVSRVPQERHSLGVRFGFSEAALEFRSNGLAPMRRGEDGAVQLDCGRLGGVSERLVVTYEVDGAVTGRSVLPAQTTDDAPLEARVLEARNTIFSQELWHELGREARTLAAYDVKLVGSRLTCAVDANSSICVELVPLGLEASDQPELLPDNAAAESVSLALHVLLSYAHRHNELTRTRPLPPHLARSRGPQTHALLRPIVARMVHARSTEACVQHLGALVRALQRARLPTSFVLKTPPSMLVDLPDPASSRGPNQASVSPSLIRNMLQPIDFHVKISLLPDIFFTVRGRTFLFPVTDTYYHVLLPPASPLASLCPPYKDGYPDLKALADFVHTAIARVLAHHFLPLLAARPASAAASASAAAAAAAASPADEPVMSVGGNSIRYLDSDDFELTFDVVDRGHDTTTTTTQNDPCLVVTKESGPAGKPVVQEWLWSGRDDVPDPGVGLEDLVHHIREGPNN